MLKLYYAPRTRSARILWLLEELGLACEIERVEFKPTSGTFFQQQTPTGKLPTLEDDGVVISAADIMMGFTLVAAQLVGVLDDRHPRVGAYLARLRERPAFTKVLADR